ncbi:MAG: hypothetical protein JW808_01620 [Victivallales bacterium]|nr:hypothetical protein [Victivallales bacterium]
MLIILMGSLSQSCPLHGIEPLLNDAPAEADTKRGRGAADTVAQLEARLIMAQRELELLRKEFAEVLKQSDARDEEYLRLQTSVAASISEGARKEYSKQNLEVLKALQSLSQAGRELVTLVMECCDFLEDIFAREAMTDVDKARAKLRLGRLKTSAESFNFRIQPRPEDLLFQSCRVLAVNDSLQIVVLDAGAASGVRGGIMLHTEDRACRLVVIETRQFISAALVTEGDISRLARGTVLVPGQ